MDKVDGLASYVSEIALFRESFKIIPTWATYLVLLEWREVLHKLFYKDLEFGKLQYALLQY